MYTLPFYTESESLKGLAKLWSGEPMFSLETTSLPCDFWLRVYGHKPPVIVVGASESLLRQRFVEKLAAAVLPERSYIVVLVSSTEESLLVESLSQGADRVVSVPQCSAPIFRALIKSLLPRTLNSSVYTPYRINPHARTVVVGEQSIQLRPLVFELARYLFVHHGSIVPRATLLRDLWGLDDRQCKTRRVESHASLMKKKLQLDGTYGWRLRSTRGKGCGYGVFRVETRHTRRMTLISDTQKNDARVSGQSEYTVP